MPEVNLDENDEITAAAATLVAAPTPAADPAPAPAAAKATKAAAAAKPTVAPTGKEILAGILKRKPESFVRLLSPGGRLGNAFAPDVVYGPNVSLRRRVIDIKENVWEQKQIVSGVLVLESDDEG